MIVLVWIGMIALAALQIPSLITQKQWGELAAFAAIWTAGGIYASMITLEAPIPSLFEIIRFLLDGAYRMAGIN